MDPISAFFISTIIGGIAGNRADFLTVELFNKLTKRFTSGSRPKNHDIEKAIRKCCLLATMIVCETVKEKEDKKAGWKHVFSFNPIVNWVNQVKNDYRKEIRKISSNNYLMDNNFSTFDPFLLLKPDDDQLKVRIGQLKEKLTSEFLSETKQKYPNAPDIFIDFMQNGWSDEEQKNKYCWFEYLCAFFAEELKENIRLKNALDSQVLTNLNFLNFPINIKNLSDELTQQGKEATQNINNIQSILKHHGKKLDEITNQINYLVALEKNVSDLISRELKRNILSNSYIGRDIAQRVEERINSYVARDFHGRDNVFNEINNFIATEPNGWMLITSLAGVGKSAILSQWITSSKNNNIFILSHFFSIDDIYKVNDAYKNILRQLFVYYELEDQEIPEQTDRVKDMILGLIKKFGVKNEEGLVIVIDGLDEAENTFIPPFPKSLPDGMFVIVSARSSKEEIAEYVIPWNNNAHRIHLNHLDKSALTIWMKTKPLFIAMETDKQDEFINQLYQKTNGFPLYIRYLLEDIDKKITDSDDLISFLKIIPNEFGIYVKTEFKQLAKNENIKNDRQIQLLFAMISVAYNLLSESDIENTTELTVWDLSALPWQITRWLDIQVLKGEKHYKFAHPLLAQEFNKILGKQVLKAKQILLQYCNRWKEVSSNYIFSSFANHLIEENEYLRLYTLLTDSNEWCHKKRLYFLSNEQIKEDIDLALQSLVHPCSSEELQYYFKLNILEKLLKSKFLISGIEFKELHLKALFEDTIDALIIANSIQDPHNRMRALACVLKATIIKQKDNDLIKNVISTIISDWEKDDTVNFNNIESLIGFLEELTDKEVTEKPYKLIANKIYEFYDRLIFFSEKVILLTRLFELKNGILDQKILKQMAAKLYEDIDWKPEELENILGLILYAAPPNHIVSKIEKMISKADPLDCRALDILAAYYIETDMIEKGCQLMEMIDKPEFLPTESVLALVKKKMYQVPFEILQKSYPKLSHFFEIKKIVHAFIENNEDDHSFDKLIENLPDNEDSSLSEYFQYLRTFNYLYNSDLEKGKKMLSDIKSRLNNLLEKDDIEKLYFAEFYFTNSLAIMETIWDKKAPKTLLSFLANFPLITPQLSIYILFYLFGQDDKSYAIAFLDKIKRENFINEKVKTIALYLLSYYDFSVATQFYNEYYISINISAIKAQYFTSLLSGFALGFKRLGLTQYSDVIFNYISKEFRKNNRVSLSQSQLKILDTILLYNDNSFKLNKDEKVAIFPVYIESCLQKNDFELAYKEISDFFQSIENNNFNWENADKFFLSLVILIKKTSEPKYRNLEKDLFDLTSKSLKYLLKEGDIESSSYLIIPQKTYFYELLVLCGENGKINQLIRKILLQSSISQVALDEYNIVDSLISACIARGYFQEVKELIAGLGWNDFHFFQNSMQNIQPNNKYLNNLQRKVAQYPLFINNNRKLSNQQLHPFLNSLKNQNIESYLLYLLNFINSDNQFISNNSKKKLLFDCLQILNWQDQGTWKQAFFELSQTGELEVKDKTSKQNLIVPFLEEKEAPAEVKSFLSFFTGDVYFKTKQFEKAIDTYSLASQLTPDDPLFLSRKGICNYVLGNYQNAITDLKICLSNENIYWFVIRWLLMSYIDSQEYDKAVIFLKTNSKLQQKDKIYFMSWLAIFKLCLLESKQASVYISQVLDELNKLTDQNEIDKVTADTNMLLAYVALLEKEREKAKHYFLDAWNYYQKNERDPSNYYIPMVIFAAGHKNIVSENEIKKITDQLYFSDSFIFSDFNYLRRKLFILTELSILTRILDVEANTFSNLFQPLLINPGYINTIKNEVVINNYHLMALLTNMSISSFSYLINDLKEIFKFSDNVSVRIESSIYENRLGIYKSSPSQLHVFPDISPDLIHEKVVIMVQGENVFGTKVYSYVEMSLENMRKMARKVANNENFKPSDYGEVLAEGVGDPPISLRLRMAQEHNLLNVPNAR